MHLSSLALALMYPSALMGMEMTARQLRDNVEEAFDKLDTNHDGILTRDEFINSCLQVISTKISQVTIHFF